MAETETYATTAAGIIAGRVLGPFKLDWVETERDLRLWAMIHNNINCHVAHMDIIVIYSRYRSAPSDRKWALFSALSVRQQYYMPSTISQFTPHTVVVDKLQISSTIYNIQYTSYNIQHSFILFYF